MNPTRDWAGPCNFLLAERGLGGGGNRLRGLGLVGNRTPLCPVDRPSAWYSADSCSILALVGFFKHQVSIVYEDLARPTEAFSKE